MFNKKKKYFKKKLEGVQKTIWDMEFKKEKTLMIREEVRREYDNTSAKLKMVEDNIKSKLMNPDAICEVHNPEPGKEKVHKDKGTCTCQYKDNTMAKADIEGLYDKKEVLTIAKLNYQAQMDRMDLDVNGSPQTNQYPEGIDGLNQQLDALQELKTIMAQYLKEI